MSGSWELSIYVTNLQIERILLVNGDQHIGGVMLKLVEALDITSDWSDHALYWPDKTLWLSRARYTLDQYEVRADARLWFTPMHLLTRIQLPDLQLLVIRVDFSVNVFSVVVRLCREIGIRHPEELSLSRKLGQIDLKKNQGVTGTRKNRLPTGLTSYNQQQQQQQTTANNTGSNPNLFSDHSVVGHSGSGLRTPATADFFSAEHHLQHSSPFSTNAFNANGALTPSSGLSLSFDRLDQTNFTTDLSNADDASDVLRPNLNRLNLAASPAVGYDEAVVADSRGLLNFRDLSEKARLNKGWLDSSRSLLEQGVKEMDTLFLRFKFFNFYDLNPKYDEIRVNQLYEQAKWSIISGETDCSEDEMVLFASLQRHIESRTGNDKNASTRYSSKTDPDDITSALLELQSTLGISENGGEQRGGFPEANDRSGSLANSNGCRDATVDRLEVPELTGYLRCYRPKKFSLKTFKTFFFVLKESQLSVHKNFEDRNDAQKCLQIYNLKDPNSFNVAYQVHSEKHSFILKINFTNKSTAIHREETNNLGNTGNSGNTGNPGNYLKSSTDSLGTGSSSNVGQNEYNTEIWLQFDEANQYSRWLAALRLLGRGKTMAGPTYEAEVKLSLDLATFFASRIGSGKSAAREQNCGDGDGDGGGDEDGRNDEEIRLKDYMSRRHFDRFSSKSSRLSLQKRINRARKNINSMSHFQCKMNFIQAWQNLAEYGLKYFIVKLKNSKKEELLAIGPDMLYRLDLKKGNILEKWSYQHMKMWTINWEIKQLQVEFEEGMGTNLAFQCLTADCKVVHEFIGGYIFLSMRSGDKSQVLDETLFHKLTGGWI